MSKLEELARELESIHDRRDELQSLIEHVRDDAFDRGMLLQELLDARLGFFAHKLVTSYYDNNAEAYANHLVEVGAEKEVETIAKDAIQAEPEVAQPAEEVPVEQPAAQPVDNAQTQLCPTCGMRFDSEFHRFQCEAGPHEVPTVEEAPVAEEVVVEQPAAVDAQEVGVNEGTEDRPVTPPPADPSAPGPNVPDGTEQTAPEAFESEDGLKEDAALPDEPVEMPEVPQEKIPEGDVHQTTSDSLMFGEHPETENAENGASIQGNPLLEAQQAQQESPVEEPVADAPAEQQPEFHEEVAPEVSQAEEPAQEEVQPEAPQAPHEDNRNVSETNPLLENPQPSQE